MIFELKGHPKEEHKQIKEEMTISLIHDLEDLIKEELENIDKDTDLDFVKDKIMYNVLKFKFESNKGNENIINDYCRDYYWSIKDNPNYEFKIP